MEIDTISVIVRQYVQKNKKLHHLMKRRRDLKLKSLNENNEILKRFSFYRAVLFRAGLSLSWNYNLCLFNIKIYYIKKHKLKLMKLTAFYTHRVHSSYRRRCV